MKTSSQIVQTFYKICGCMISIQKDLIYIYIYIDIYIYIYIYHTSGYIEISICRSCYDFLHP